MLTSAPVPLEPLHKLTNFECGNATLNIWLSKKALKNQSSGATRTFVTCFENKVVGFYALATGSIEHKNVSAAIRRNMPQPIPIIILTRLAVDISCQGTGLGKHLLKDALLRAVQVANTIGVRAVVVHALNEDVVSFYKQFGFQQSVLSPHTLFLSVNSIKQALL